MSLGYRLNVAAIIVNDRGEILACERSDVDGAWQLPQGGIHKGESPRDALFRELEEEIGTRDVEVLDELPFTIRYEWPEHLYKKGHRGQEQHYFLVRLADEDAVDIQAHDGHLEFQNTKWMQPLEFASCISGFKAEAYLQALEEFSKRTELLNYSRK